MGIAKNIGVDVVFGATSAALDAKLNTLQGKLKNMSAKFSKVGLAMTAGISVPLGFLATQSIGAARGFETAFTGVQKTVEATEAQFAELKTGILAMSQELPASAVEIAKVAEAGGQLGVQTENLLSFTRTMIDLGEATSLGSEEAAISLSRMANIMGTSQDKFQNFGSAIVDLGNNLAANESEILAMATRMATFGKQAGLTEADVLAFSGALVSVGVQAQAGGTAFGLVLTTMKDAVLSGGEELDEFARVAGVSAQAFAEQFRMAPAEAVQSFVAGLGKIQNAGQSMTGTLETLGLSNERAKLALGAISGEADKVSTALNIAATGWKENSALTAEVAKRYATTDSVLAKLNNSVERVKVSMGDALLPVIKEIATAITPAINKLGEFAEWFGSLDASVKKTALIFAGTFAIGGPILLALGAFMAIVATISAPLLIGGLIVGGIIAGTLALIANWDTLKVKASALWDRMMSSIRTTVDANLKNIIEAWTSLKTKVMNIVQALVDGVTAIFRGIMNIADGVKAFTNKTVGLFQGMYDTVVGKSIVPDMVKGIGQEFRDLNKLMTVPTILETNHVIQAFQQMASGVRLSVKEANHSMVLLRTGFAPVVDIEKPESKFKLAPRPNVPEFDLDRMSPGLDALKSKARDFDEFRMTLQHLVTLFNELGASLAQMPNDLEPGLIMWEAIEEQVFATSRQIQHVANDAVKAGAIGEGAFQRIFDELGDVGIRFEDGIITLKEYGEALQQIGAEFLSFRNVSSPALMQNIALTQEATKATGQFVEVQQRLNQRMPEFSQAVRDNQTVWESFMGSFKSSTQLMADSLVFTFGTIRTTFTNTVVGMIAGTTTMVEVLNSLWQSLLGAFLNMILQMGLQWAIATFFQTDMAKQALEAQVISDTGRVASTTATETARLAIMETTNKAVLAGAGATLAAMAVMGTAAVGIMGAMVAAIAAVYAAIAAGLAAGTITAPLAAPFAAAAKIITASGLAAVALSEAGIATAVGVGTKALGALATPIPGLHAGGIVTAPTLAMLGERGQKEAVMPLDKLDSYMNRQPQTLVLEIDSRKLMEKLIPQFPKVVRMKLGAAL